MSRHSACNLPTCAVVVDGRVGTCPKCGGPMRDVSDSPVRGIVMLVCGVLLTGMMGWILLDADGLDAQSRRRGARRLDLHRHGQGGANVPRPCSPW